MTELQAQIALLEQLVREVDYLQTEAQGAQQATVAPTMPSDDQLRALIAPLVAEAISAAFGRLETVAGTTAAAAQPEVAPNTGSGAAPEAPAAHPASDGAGQLSPAAGTAPTQAQG